MKKSLIAMCTTVALLALGALPSVAGTTEEPEITDPVGDANGLSVATGNQEDTRPASLDNADLRAVWFETAYDTNKVVDPATGQVLSVQYTPTALLVHIKTEAAVHPTQPEGRSVRYVIPATLPGCNAELEFTARPNASDDSAIIWARTAGCGDVSSGSGRGATVSTVSIEGTLTTISFPLGDTGVAQFVSVGSRIDDPSARSSSPFGFNVEPVFDSAATGTGFTVGQDVPPNVNCSADPTHPECQS